MNKYKNLTLCVYQGNYDLPSIDPKCAQILFFLKLHPGHNITIINTECLSNPLVPCLFYRQQWITDQKEIFDILYNEVTQSCDMRFNNTQRIQIAQHLTINDNILGPLYILYSWGIKANAHYLKKLYCGEKRSCVKKEFGLMLVRHNKLLINNILEGRAFNICYESQISSAYIYLEHLEELIAGKMYMLGDNPSTFDAHVCGYLAPLLRLKFPNTDFQKKLFKCKALCKYVKRFLTKYGEKNVNRFPTMVKPKQDNWSLKCFTQCLFWISLTGLIWAAVIYSQN